MTNKSIFGLNENIAAALSYLFGAFSGVVVLILERENKFVRFHALQSTLCFLFLYITVAAINFVTNVISSIPLLGGLFGFFLSPVGWLVYLFLFVLKIYLMFRAYEGKTTKLPILGDVVWGQIFK